MALTSGTKLGPYEIVGHLGAGGMGEVYHARHIHLGRSVAIKILSAAFSADPDRLLRFEQEARSASALNHPNIVTIYELGQDALPVTLYDCGCTTGKQEGTELLLVCRLPGYKLANPSPTSLR